VAVEERIEALLALDHHAEVVPDLERLAVAHPYRERFTAQLMVALHRRGREVETHRANQQFRSSLAEDSGLEPGAQLIQLDRSIAAGDAAVGTASERRPRGYVSVSCSVKVPAVRCTAPSSRRRRRGSTRRGGHEVPVPRLRKSGDWPVVLPCRRFNVGW
jgi:DNA-binding SARP family transcriptional activator